LNILRKFSYFLFVLSTQTTSPLLMWPRFNCWV
jgi:hypothetical protein